jgi:Bacterial EndoU nuclease
MIYFTNEIINNKNLNTQNIIFDLFFRYKYNYVINYINQEYLNYYIEQIEYLLKDKREIPLEIHISDIEYYNFPDIYMIVYKDYCKIQNDQDESFPKSNLTTIELLELLKIIKIEFVINNNYRIPDNKENIIIPYNYSKINLKAFNITKNQPDEFGFYEIVYEILDKGKGLSKKGKQLMFPDNWDDNKTNKEIEIAINDKNRKLISKNLFSGNCSNGIEIRFATYTNGKVIIAYPFKTNSINSKEVNNDNKLIQIVTEKNSNSNFIKKSLFFGFPNQLLNFNLINNDYLNYYINQVELLIKGKRPKPLEIHISDVEFDEYPDEWIIVDSHFCSCPAELVAEEISNPKITTSELLEFLMILKKEKEIGDEFIWDSRDTNYN